MTTVLQVIDEATAALARHDADALGELEQRALQLHALRMESGEAAEAGARLRVFASVLRETDRGLGILRRVRGEEQPWGR